MIMCSRNAPQEPAAAPADVAELETAATVEAILFGADRPLPPAKVSEIGELGGARAVRKAVALLNGRYEQVGSSFRIVEIAEGYQMQSLPEYSDVLARLHQSRSESRLTQAALETLAIVAYRQPVLRADVEAIRGVACGEVLRGLMEKNLLRIVGRAEEIGRPLLYGTTRHFLEVFGLGSLDDLPSAEQLRRPAGPAEAQNAPTGQQEEQAQPAEEPAEPDSGAADQAGEQQEELPEAETDGG
jgi:segregation and condensation protein B